METSVRVRIIIPLYQSITKLVQSLLKLKGAHGSGLGHFEGKIARPIILFESISPEARVVEDSLVRPRVIG